MAINANDSGYVVAPSPASRKESASLTFSWLPDPFRLEFGGSIMKAPLARSRWSGLILKHLMERGAGILPSTEVREACWNFEGVLPGSA